ncbi:MAG TPA: class I SAM-dependent rRNA methyltransferase [Candidatus Hydrogenedentes bacterium]|nr:class I SAM-dependent rRNA methyltransferase [Candidatus Hydrogenedentota bacterium]
MSSNARESILTLKPGEERRLLRGHRWVYRNEVATLSPTPADGDVVDIYSAERRFIGRGYYQQAGGIAARIFSSHQENPDEVFWQKRLRQAATLRERLFPAETVYRWIFGESDHLPGLVIDRYDQVAVVTFDNPFFENRLDTLVSAIRSTSGIASVHVSRSGGDPAWYGEPHETVRFEVNGLRGAFCPTRTQKTGLFLDQRSNWPVIRRFAEGAEVLDGHCYHGWWGLHAAAGGAARVTACDTSMAALEQARENAALNGMENRFRFELQPVEELLARSEQTYDVIVLDPPALAKSRTHVKPALSRYVELNALALRRVRPDGILITSSCSHFVDNDLFEEILKRASSKARRRVSILEWRGASPDHPILLSMPETRYLKCVVLRVE